jgi:hypothetical protein
VWHTLPVPYQGVEGEAPSLRLPRHNPSAYIPTFAIDIPESPFNSISDEHLQSREGIDVIDGAPLSTIEAAGRDIVDVLLEQWTVPVGASSDVVLVTHS